MGDSAKTRKKLRTILKTYLSLQTGRLKRKATSVIVGDDENSEKTTMERIKRKKRKVGGDVMEKGGVCRWMVDISTWHPSPQDISFALSVLPHSEHPSVLRFVRTEDIKRALVSRLLQYVLALEVAGIPYQEIVIRRTPEGKPYLECDETAEKFPNFNFNASHHGDFVGIASEPVSLVGLDIVCYSKPEKELAKDFIRHFRPYFSSFEWKCILGAGNGESLLIEFYRYWCIKEAYVKAIGSGVGFGLERLEFHHNNWSDIYVKVDGKRSHDWKFWMTDFGERQCVSVAIGPPGSAAESYRKTLTQIDHLEEHSDFFNLPGVDFVWRTVEELVSVLDRAK